MSQKYIGSVISVPEKFGFIGIKTVTKDDGSEHDINTTADIFLHSNELGGGTLVPQITVCFQVAQDERRGENYFKATNATIVAQIVLPDQPIPGLITNIGSGSAMTVHQHPIGLQMKDVPAETVETVIRNAPLKDVSDDSNNKVAIKIGSPEELLAFLEHYLKSQYPVLLSIISDFRVIGYDEEATSKTIVEQISSYQELGMNDQATLLQEQYNRFQEDRRLLSWLVENHLLTECQLSPMALQMIIKMTRETQDSANKRVIVDSIVATVGFMSAQGILTPNSIIPIRNLVDLFCAAPVWYVAMDKENGDLEDENWEETDPIVHPFAIDICDLFPNQRWIDSFLMFNRRTRSLKRYEGENIPPHILRVISQARSVFTHVIILTPYHDVAGADWEDLDWLRAIDPYVIGLRKGVSSFFVLGRFSDGGVFPLLNELVGDTIEFLRANKQKLKGFNKIGQPYWYMSGRRDACLNGGGEHLIAHTENLLLAFESGRLFDWLRSEWDLPTALLTEKKPTDQITG